MMTRNVRLLAVALLLVLWYFRPSILPPHVPGQRLISVIYESADMPIPRQALEARPLLPAELRVVDDDIVDGDGNVPRELKASIEAARKNGLPALVVAAGDYYDTIVLCVDLPDTAEEIVEAVK